MLNIGMDRGLRRGTSGIMAIKATIGCITVGGTRIMMDLVTPSTMLGKTMLIIFL